MYFVMRSIRATLDFRDAENFLSKISNSFCTGLEIVLNNSKRNLGINIGGRYNLTNLFNADNALPTAGQTDNFNLNDGGEAGGPGFKRYIGIFSLDVGLNIYPDVKKTKR